MTTQPYPEIQPPSPPPKSTSLRETGITSSSPLPPPWYTHLTLDTLLLVLSRTLFHPFPAFILPLSLRALATPLTHPSFILTTAYFLLVLSVHVGAYVSHRVAFGPARAVDFEHEDEAVVITGGARGLGQCVAEIYGMRGASVAVLDREVDEEEGGEEEGIRFFRCDVGDWEEVERVWKRVVEELGTPTILINNAAILHQNPLLKLTYPEIEATFRTNTLSHYHLTSLFLPPLLTRPSGGTLVTISSTLAHLGASHLSAYTASKAALLAFHASLAAELPSNIKPLLVIPGQLGTPLFAHVRLGPVARFFAPVVEVRELAVRLVRWVDSGEGGVLAVPAYARWIAWLGVLPWGVQKVVRRWSGIDDVEARRTGRRGDRN